MMGLLGAFAKIRRRKQDDDDQQEEAVELLERCEQAVPPEEGKKEERYQKEEKGIYPGPAVTIPHQFISVVVKQTNPDAPEEPGQAADVINSQEEVEISNLFEKLEQQLVDWVIASKTLAEDLRDLEAEMIKHHKNAHIAKVTGHSTAAVGSALIVAGVATAFFTFGTSLALTLAGTTITTAGSVTASGAVLAEWKLLDKLAKKADVLFQQQAERTNEITQTLHKLEALVTQVINKKRMAFSEKAGLTIEVGTVVWNMGSLTWTSISTTVSLVQGVSAGLSAAAQTGGFVLNAGLPLLAAASTASKGFTVVGGVLTAVTIPVDMAYAGWSVYRLAVGSVPEKAEDLRGLINILEASVEQVEAAMSRRDFQELLKLFRHVEPEELPAAETKKEKKERIKREKQEKKKQRAEQKKQRAQEKKRKDK